MTPATRRLWGPALITAVMVLTLIGLGTWQVMRLQWKQAILAQIEAGERAEPAPLGIPEGTALGVPPRPYTKVSVTGQFRFDKVASYGADVRDTRAGPTMGTLQIVPLERTGAPPILVDRGWIPQPVSKPLDDPAGTVTVIGYVRPTEAPHWFSPAADLAARRFYTLDTSTIGITLGLPEPEPFVLVALGAVPPGTYPAPAQHLPRPSNNHLAYAITWYGLAVAALVVFVVWARKRPVS